MLGPQVVKSYKFKADFDRMELWRDGKLIEPIYPGKVAEVVNRSDGLGTLQDIQYYGAYEYAPEAFQPGPKLVLRIWRQGDDEPRIKEVSPKIIQRIWDDFRPYFRARRQDERARS